MTVSPRASNFLWTSGLLSVYPRCFVGMSFKFSFNPTVVVLTFPCFICLQCPWSKTELPVTPQPIFKYNCKFLLWSSSCFMKGSYFLGPYVWKIDCLVPWEHWTHGRCLSDRYLWELVETAHTALGLHILCFSVHRMNNGPVLGHEEEVGRRTTFRLFYPESVFSDPKHNDPNTTAILTAFKPHDLKWLWELLTGGKIVSWQDCSPFWLP